MLATEVPPDVHQLDGVERGTPAPRRSCRVGAFAFEGVFDRHEAVPVPSPHVTPRLVPTCANRDDIGVLEHAGSNEVGLGREQLFGDAGPQQNRAAKPIRAP